MKTILLIFALTVPAFGYDAHPTNKIDLSNGVASRFSGKYTKFDGGDCSLEHFDFSLTGLFYWQGEDLKLDMPFNSFKKLTSDNGQSSDGGVFSSETLNYIVTMKRTYSRNVESPLSSGAEKYQLDVYFPTEKTTSENIIELLSARPYRTQILYRCPSLAGGPDD